MFSPDEIEAVKDSASIYDTVSDHVKLKKDGANWKGLCPFHDEKSPSFTVSPSKNIYKCFGCGKSGNAITFLVEHCKMSFVDAMKKLASENNIRLEEKQYAPKKVYVKPAPITSGLTELTKDYFISRGISETTLVEMAVTEGVEWMPKAKAEIPVICFNYIWDGELVNIKFRGKNKDFKLVKDAKLIFYNLDAIKGAKEVIIVEGEPDALSWHEAGFKAVVSVPNGANVNGALNLEYLDNCWEAFKDAEKIILATDGDEAGTRLREELSRRLGKDRCFKVSYPTAAIIDDKKLGEFRAPKDTNEVLINYGRDGVRSIYESAEEFPIEGFLTVGEDLAEEILHFWEYGYPAGIKLGISEDFDKLLAFQGGQFTIVTGIPGSGKSEFIDYIAAESVNNHGWKWGICSFENQPASIHATKLMQKMSGRAFGHRRDIYDRMTQDQMESNLLKTHDHCYFLKLKDTDINLDIILEKFEQLVLRKGARGFILDPWNYIETNKPNGITDTDHISQCLTKIKLFVSKTNSHLFLVAHPTKLKKENGRYEVPTLYSISGSAHFFNKTDNGFSVYRDFDTGIVSIFVQKVRFEWNGRLGQCDFNYDREKRQYMPIITGM